MAVAGLGLRDGVEVDVEGASKAAGRTWTGLLLRDETSGIDSKNFENNNTDVIKQACNIVEYKRISTNIKYQQLYDGIL